MSTWDDGSRPVTPAITRLGWLRVALRGVPILILLAVCFPLLLALRLPERVIFGMRRPATPFVTQFVCISVCWIANLKRHITGRPMEGQGALVANHSSWLDIFVLNASSRVFFVSKEEVAGWPGIGWLARGTGTVFIKRARTEAAAQQRILEDRLTSGHRLVFFPEGTSTDGSLVLPFKSTLFAAFLTENLKDTLAIQPVTVRYHAPQDQDRRFYGWWGAMEFGPSALKILAAKHPGRVDVTFHEALAVVDYSNRKALAQAAEVAVRDGFTASGP